MRPNRIQDNPLWPHFVQYIHFNNIVHYSLAEHHTIIDWSLTPHERENMAKTLRGAITAAYCAFTAPNSTRQLYRANPVDVC